MLRWLILGAGGWGGNYVRATRAMRGVRVVGYVDTNAKALRRLEADGIDAKLLSDDALEAIARTAPDVISCSIPNPQRVPILVEAIKRAPAVIVDKPLAHTPADVRRIVAAAAKSGARVCVGQDYRYKPGTQKVKALLEAGRVGRLSNVTVQFIGNASFVAHTFYGGLEGPRAIGLEMGIHHFDMMRWFIGQEPRAVEARSWRPPWGYGTADTTLHALVEFGDELRATYAADWNSKAEHTSWSGRWILAGERADVLWDDAQDGTVDVRLVRRSKKGPVEQRFSPKAKAYSMELIIRAFTDAVKSGGPMPVPLDDNVKSIGFALAAAESCKRRKPIDVARFMEKEGLLCR
jgi:predicted dehydrogenase